MSLAVDRLAHRGHAQAVKKRKMPTDVNQRAAATARMVDAILGDPEAEPTKNPAAVALGKLGGAKGGLEMAIWARGSTLPGLVHHSDRGVQGGFHRSSQHLETEVFDGRSRAGVGNPGFAGPDLVTGQTIDRAA